MEKDCWRERESDLCVRYMRLVGCDKSSIDPLAYLPSYVTF